ncbi:MAG: hypothetical protein ACR2GX_07575 [Candidatus Dormibacteria bacterium]
MIHERFQGSDVRWVHLDSALTLAQAPVESKGAAVSHKGHEAATCSRFYKCLANAPDLAGFRSEQRPFAEDDVAWYRCVHQFVMHDLEVFTHSFDKFLAFTSGPREVLAAHQRTQVAEK